MSNAPAHSNSASDQTSLVGGKVWEKGKEPKGTDRSSGEEDSNPVEDEIIWSGWENVRLIKGKAPRKCLVTATVHSLTIWDTTFTVASDASSASSPCSMVEVLRIQSEGKPEWTIEGAQGEVILGRVLSGQTENDPERVLVGLGFEPNGKGKARSALMLYDLITLEFQRKVVVEGTLCDVRCSEKGVVISTLNPPALLLLHPSTFQPLHPPVLFPPSYPISQPPVFTLSNRLLAFATTRPPESSALPLRRASGTRADSGGDRSRSNPTWGSLGSSHGGTAGAGGGERQLEEDVEENEEEGEWTGGGAANGGIKVKSRPIPASSSVPRKRTSSISHHDHHHSHPHPTRPSAQPSVEEQSIQIVELPSSSPGSAKKPTLHTILHFYPSLNPHSTQPINHLSFSPNSQMLFISQAPSCVFSIVEIRPSSPGGLGASKELGESWERYVLRRGVREGVVRFVQWDKGGRWIGVGTGKGTLHVYPLNPYGGVPVGHLQGKVVNTMEMQPLSINLQPVIRIHQPRNTSHQSSPSSPSLSSRPSESGDNLSPSSSPQLSGLRRFSQFSTSPTAASSVLLFTAGFKPGNVGNLALPPVSFCFVTEDQARRSGLGSERAPAYPEPSLDGRAPSNGSGPPLPVGKLDILVFYPSTGQLSLHKALMTLVPPGSPSLSSGPPAVQSGPRSPPGGSSALSLMMMARKKAEGLVGGGPGALGWEIKNWEAATWELGSGGGKGEIGLEASVGRKKKREGKNKHNLVAWSLSNAEIQTTSPSLKILPGPLYLSHQFEFHHLPPPSAPAFHHTISALPSTNKLTVRNEVLLTSPSSSPYPYENGSLPSPFATPSIGSQSNSGAFDSMLERAIESSLGSLPRRTSKPIIPGYPNGDGPTISPRSWKNSTKGIVDRVPVLVSSTASVLGDFKREFGERVGSPSSSFSSPSSFNSTYLLTGANRRASKSLSSKPANGLSFEDETIYDPMEYSSPVLVGETGSSFDPSIISIKDGLEEERWEDEEEGALERYRRLAKEEGEFDDLVCGVEDLGV